MLSRRGLRGLRGLVCLVAAMGTAAVIAPPAAWSSHETLVRSVGNISQAPLDLALSPLVAWSKLNRNIVDVDDTLGVRLAYYVPGYVWLVGVNVGASVLRGVTGALELLPGLILLPFKTDLDPLYDPVERGAALIEFDNPVFPVKFGIDYQAPTY